MIIASQIIEYKPRRGEIIKYSIKKGLTFQRDLFLFMAVQKLNHSLPFLLFTYDGDDIHHDVF